MQGVYLVSVWLHVLAAITWIGGMAFLVLVVVPWLRGGGRAHAAPLLRDTGPRFRTVGWICFGVLVVTGTFNLSMRGVRFIDLFRPEWRASSFGHLVLVKLGLFASVLAISAVHDFLVGPAATRAIEADPSSEETAALRRRASLLGRANALLALVLVAVAVMIVRGTP